MACLKISFHSRLTISIPEGDLDNVFNIWALSGGVRLECALHSCYWDWQRDGDKSFSEAREGGAACVRQGFLDSNDRSTTPLESHCSDVLRALQGSQSLRGGGCQRGVPSDGLRRYGLSIVKT